MNTADEHATELLPEVALGLLDGHQLAEVLTHVDGCERCRQELDDLVRTADLVLSAGPHAEPPPGFESAVLARLASQRRRRTATRWLAAVAAAAVALIGTVSALAARDDGAPHGTTVASAKLVSGSTMVGWAWVLPGDPARVAIDMTYSAPVDPTYGTSVVPVTIQLFGEDGAEEEQHVTVLGGSFNGVVRLHGDGHDLTRVRMVGPDGTVLCHGSLT